MTSVTRTERLWVLIFALGVMLLTWLPYALAWGNTPADSVFNGHLIGSEDGNSYIAKMRWGAFGHARFELFYTTEPHQGQALIFPLHLLIGWLVGQAVGTDDPLVLHQALVMAYHLWRTVGGVALIMVYHAVFVRFLSSPTERWLALGVCTLGGGLGIIAVGWGVIPPEMVIPEAFSFLSLLSLPHLLVARALLLGGMLAFLDGERRPNRYVWAGVAWNMMGMLVPFYLALIGVLVGVYWLLSGWWCGFRWGILRGSFISVGMTLPLFGYYTWVFTTHAVFAQWSAQNLLPSPAVWVYLLSYGVMLVPCGFALPSVFKIAQQDRAWVWLIGWLVIVPVLVYAPINVQRRLLEGVWVALVILGVVGLRMIPRWGRLLVICATLPTTLVLFLGACMNHVEYYTPQSLQQAMVWLADQPTDRAILTTRPIGNLVPMYASQRVFLGHGPETLYATDKARQVADYLNGRMPLAERTQLYRTHTLGYVLDARTMPSREGFPYPELTPQATFDNVTVYRIFNP
ncbi:MAG: hypothetical protein ACOYLB_17050 [Phototrophicaceae bacterium]